MTKSTQVVAIALGTVGLVLFASAAVAQEEDEEARRAAFEEYRACMAEHGVELPEPPVGKPGPDAQPPHVDRGAAEAAFEQCQEELPLPPGVTAEEFEAHRAEMEEFRRCLSEHGVETPGPGIPTLDGPPRRAEPSDEQREQFEAAAEACAELRPEPLPGGRVPGRGPGGPGEPKSDDEQPAEETGAS